MQSTWVAPGHGSLGFGRLWIGLKRPSASLKQSPRAAGSAWPDGQLNQRWFGTGGGYRLTHVLVSESESRRPTQSVSQCPMISSPSPSQWHCLKKIDHFDPIHHAGAPIVARTTQACTNTRTTPEHHDMLRRNTHARESKDGRCMCMLHTVGCWLPRFERGKERKTSAWQPTSALYIGHVPDSAAGLCGPQWTV